MPLFVQVCVASGAVYLEFTAYFPSRSGSEVVFLEQAYPRPMWFFPTTFAVQNVILSFASSNAIGKYPHMTKSSSTLQLIKHTVSIVKLFVCHIG